MSEWGINFGREVTGQTSGVGNGGKTEPGDYVSLPMTSGVEPTIETPWQKMMGVDIKGSAPQQAFFTTAELDAFVAPYLKYTDSFTAETAAEALEGVTEEQLYVFENVVPEGVKEYYAGHHTDGTAKRVDSMPIMAYDVPDFTGGDAELLNIAELLFEDAART